ncbi:E3 ubiquitin-protein ligase TRIM56-like [Ylistrum balloti]|uniref:E3 ubiquitin-protein ligase TRIM56-like n=1 Tax=Ylistrum balloti TaxID=509963 RepID=UPI002905BB7A|nr:E3 ubiquitin-protein ligase TRIM56-like [Ylistrum balloti]
MAMPNDSGDLTVCSICLQIFTVPKYLPCLHTFCEQCLQSWIESQVSRTGSNIRNVVFMCPICRTLTNLPGSANKRDKWASTFPSNHIIVSLIDKSMIERRKKSCDSCTEMKKSVPANHWCVQCSEAYCDQCTHVHQAMKATRKHKVVGLQDVLSDLKCLSSDEMCNEHAEEVIKLYCVDHDQPCCTICGATSHRKCNNVLELSEASNNVRNKQEFSDLLTNLTECEREISKTSKSLQENLTQLNVEKLNVERSAKELADTVVNHTKALLNRFLKQLSEAHTNAMDELKNNAEKCDLQQKVISNSRQILEKSREHSADTELFLLMKRTETKRKDSKTFIEDEMPKMTLKHVRHTFSDSLQTFKNAKSFGGVKFSNSRGVTEPTDGRSLPRRKPNVFIFS